MELPSAEHMRSNLMVRYSLDSKAGALVPVLRWKGQFK
jgi:hypothetical protein